VLTLVGVFVYKKNNDGRISKQAQVQQFAWLWRCGSDLNRTVSYHLLVNGTLPLLTLSCGTHYWNVYERLP